ncbi:hypothetical protein [Adhaeribacter soli]|nr:hypothetical protein [Adhaeribacter soli]
MEDYVVVAGIFTEDWPCYPAGSRKQGVAVVRPEKESVITFFVSKD